MVVNATSSIDPVDLGDVLAEIARFAATEPALTPRPFEDLRAAASRGNVVVLRHDGGLIGWGVREVLRPGLTEIGMMFIKPAFRTPAAFIRLARELANVPEALILATYDSALVRLAVLEFGFREASLGQVIVRSRGRFLVKRLSAESRRAVREHTRTARPLCAIREAR